MPLPMLLNGWSVVCFKQVKLPAYKNKYRILTKAGFILRKDMVFLKCGKACSI
jgi:hypothetical protein